MEKPGGQELKSHCRPADPHHPSPDGDKKGDWAVIAVLTEE